MQGAPSKRLWAGKYNGLGGHVERRESVLASARRELLEETGLTADLWLCGTLLVDAGEIGICLFIFIGESIQGSIQGSKEGMPEWVHLERLASLPVVEDLPVLLGHIHRMRQGDPPFCARSYYDERGKLKVIFDT
jgi:8-oxo-dGTP diphosphatase